MKSFLAEIEDNLKYFRSFYFQLNYKLNKIYTKLKLPRKANNYVWNYIKIKIQNFKDVTKEDYEMMNLFVKILINGNSARRALIFIKKYIFHIPLIYHETR